MNANNKCSKTLVSLKSIYYINKEATILLQRNLKIFILHLTLAKLHPQAEAVQKKKILSRRATHRDYL